MSRNLRLRGIITEKLSTVASEILAAVEETLSVYEAEASGLRHELDLHRSQLQLLQPRVKEEPTDDQQLFSLCEAGGGGRPREEVGSTCGIKFENTRSLEIGSYSGEQKEDQRLSKHGSEAASRLCHSADPTDRINLDGSHIRNLENYVDLKICILNDWTIEEVSDQVDEEYPVHELQCRSDLREADFLDLLRSTFPQLAPSSPFESLIPDRSNRLRPLEVQSFTPEQICRAARNSALYIRPKRPAEHEAGSLQQPMQISDDDVDEGDCYDEDASPSWPQTPPKAKKYRREKPAGGQISGDGSILLWVRVLDDSRVVSLSKSVLKRSKLKKLRCPPGMQEPEFLTLLKSSFRQLAAGRPFELLVTNVTKKLFPLNVEPLTPEMICGAAGDSGVYVRLKPVKGDVQAGQKNRQQSKGDGDDSSSQGAPRNRNVSQSKLQTRDTDTHINLRVHVLEDSDLEAVTSDVLRKYRLNKLQCPRGMTEVDFLTLLRSTFPKLRVFETFTCDRNGRLLPLHVESFTPELICTAAGTSAVYIRLKPEDLKHDRAETEQRNQDGAHPSSPRPATPSTKNESPSRNHADEKDTHITLRVCYLEDANADMFSREGASAFRSNPQLFFKKVPIHQLKCPRGLQEKDFLAFLKSYFPHLAEDRPLSVLALQGKKMLYLKLNSMVPEEIWRTTCSIGSSVICIQQLKKLDQKEDAEPNEPPTTTPPTTPSTSIQAPTETSGGPPNCELDNLVDLKICVVNDPSVDASSPLVLQKYPVVEFQCPCSLKEAEFLNLLRSTFPQLAGETLDFLAGNDVHVKPINLENLTSEEISRNLKQAGNSFLCIQIKKQREVVAGVKRSHPDVSDQGTQSSSSRVKKQRKRAKVESSKSASHRGNEDSEDDETEDSEDDDNQKNIKSAKLMGLESLMSKYNSSCEPVKKTEEHPTATPSIQIDDDATDDSEDESFKNPQFSRLSFLRLPKPEPEAEPEETIKKEPPTEKMISQVEDEETEDSEDYDDDEDGKSSLLLSLLTNRSSSDSTQKATDFKVEEVEIVDSEDGEEDKNTTSTRVTSVQPQVSGQDANVGTTEDANVSEKREDKPAAVTLSSETEAVEIIDSEDEDDKKHSWSSSLSSLQPRTSGQDSQQSNATEAADVLENNDLNHSDAKPNSTLSTSAEESLVSCTFCKAVHGSRRMLIRHAWNHVGHPDRPCGVCGKQFDSEESIKNHLQAHQKTHRCKICGKSFLTVQGFRCHMDRHKENAPEQK